MSLILNTTYKIQTNHNPIGEFEYGFRNMLDEASASAEHTDNAMEPAKTRSALGNGAERPP